MNRCSGWTMQALSRWSAQLALRHQVLLLAVLTAVVATALIGWQSFQRLQATQLRQAEQWAVAAARLADGLAAPGYRAGNPKAVAQALSHVMALPGVQGVRLMQANGDVWLDLTVPPLNANAVPAQTRAVSGNGKPEFHAPDSAAPADGAVRPHPMHANRVLAAVRLGTHPTPEPGPNNNGASVGAATHATGWLELDWDYGSQQGRAAADWLSGMAIALLLVAVSVSVFYGFVWRATRPITQLAQFARTLSHAPGNIARLRWGSHEVRQLGFAINATSRHLAEHIETMARQLKRQHAIVDTAVDAVVGVNAEGLIVSINRASERLFGRPPGELIRQPLSTLLPMANGAFLAQLMANGIWMESTQTRQATVELHGLRQGGIRFPAELLVGEIPDDPTIRYTCIVRDTTELKQAEDFLALYARALDCSTSGVLLTNASLHPQRTVYINPAFTRITGFGPQHVMGRDIGFLNGPETEASRLAELHEGIDQGAERTVTLRHYRRDGQAFIDQMSVSPIRDSDGRITHTIHMIEDVTALAESQARLAEHSARLDATFALSPDGFVIFDASGQWQGCNPAFSAMLGEALGGQPLQAFDARFADLCQDPAAYIPVAHPDSDGDGAVHRLHLLRPSPRVLERVVRHNLRGSGETIVYLRDITRQTEVDQMKTDFLATAAHELRTPLASILGYTELMLHRKYNEERQRDMLQTVHRQAELLTSIINELLDLSRIEARQGKDFRIEALPLEELLHDAVATLKGQDPTRPVDLSPIPDVRVMADASKIQQALGNLLDNARKYADASQPIHVTVTQDHENTPGEPALVHIHIRDHGTGMTEEQLSHAFERFYRADTSGNRPGTGLGLNLVREIAQVHGGRVALNSTVGVGSVATLSLRLA